MIRTVEEFWSFFNHLKVPSELDKDTAANYHFFRTGIKPMWEDSANKNGGKWVVSFNKGDAELFDRTWMLLLMGLVGEELDPTMQICGIVVSVCVCVCVCV